VAWSVQLILETLESVPGGGSLALARGNLLTRARLWSGILALVLAVAACVDPTKPPTPPERDTEFDHGSFINPQELTQLQVDNLTLLAKVWGFAKYHDTRLILGSANWDYELFRAIPPVLAAPDRASATAAIVTWLDRLGEVQECVICAGPPADVHLSPDIGWIGDAVELGAELSGRLAAVHRNRPANGTQRYVSFPTSVGNPYFGSEEGYAQHAAPDAGYRVLALFRYWNIIQYWFPYRDVIGEDWEDVLREYIPQMLRAMSGADYRGAMIQLSARINDTHANVPSQLHLQPPTGNAQVPVALRFVEGKAVVTAYLHASLGPETGLAIGDVIEQVDGVPVETLVDSLADWYSASNEPTRLRGISRKLLRGNGPAVVSGSRAEGPFALVVQRAPLSQLAFAGWEHDRPGPAFQMLSDSVAYIKISTALAASSSTYISAALGARVLVIDIRNYPSDFPIFALGGHLVAASTPFARFTLGAPSNPGAFRWGSTAALAPLLPRFTGQIVVLVDEVTQSSAEYHAMAFRASPNAIVVGSATAGADGNVSAIPLPGAIESLISGIGVFYPDGTPTQRIGIVPDVEVRPTIAGIRAGIDEVLEAALAHAFAVSARAP
jgi:C-terminal processing protease CtpA/Prc